MPVELAPVVVTDPARTTLVPKEKAVIPFELAPAVVTWSAVTRTPVAPSARIAVELSPVVEAVPISTETAP